MNSPIRWGILSSARIGRKFAAAAAKTKSNTVVAVASRSEERASSWASELGAEHAFVGYERLIEADSIDAIYNPLPNNMHAEWTIRALQAGKPVLCEKPFTATTAEAEAVAETSRKTGVLVCEAFMYRFHPMYDRLLAMLNGGEIGEVVSVHAKFGWALENTLDIRKQAELAGGSLMDVGCYCINFARRIAGAEPSRVTAFERRTSVDDSLAGLLEFPNGMLATIESSIESQLGREAKIRGTKGRIILPEAWLPGEEHAEFIVEKGGKREVETTPGANPFQLEIEDFENALRTGRPGRWPVQDAVNNMRVIDALYESARTGKQVLLPMA